MRNLLRIEELFLFVLSIFLFGQLDYAWWWYLALFLAPDIGMVGYAAGPAAGAATYNLLHHKAVAVILYVAGAYLGSSVLQLAGVIILGHASFDRILGYGLKHSDAFKHTHLGWIGE